MEKLYCVTWNSPKTNGSGIVPDTTKGVTYHHAQQIANESNRRYKPLQYAIQEMN